LIQKNSEPLVDAAKAEIGLAFGLMVAVEQDDFLAAVARGAEIARLLAALLVGRTISERPVLHRHGRIVLLDAAAHFVEQRRPELGRVGHERFLVGVLGLEMGADRRIEHGGVPEHLLPIVGAQPGIIVYALDAVMRVGDRPLLGRRRYEVFEYLAHEVSSCSEPEFGMNI
jgi:hypothetical protein